MRANAGDHPAGLPMEFEHKAEGLAVLNMIGCSSPTITTGISGWVALMNATSVMPVKRLTLSCTFLNPGDTIRCIGDFYYLFFFWG
ncbi:hypothetical protein HORIV_28720 [Vreelandella olivaria]|uniref:Uncharacterized protein n=1 Tax=Vreelandella olivaria TaxID=390919 RepID=A0ABM7GIM3_9GAMM|nr:hypothetical protein HORIV_28720 [Halomonas olivaria]